MYLVCVLHCAPSKLLGEVFEPSKGTRGMMERWKGARLAAKEIKEMKDKEKGDKLAGTATGGTCIMRLKICYHCIGATLVQICQSGSKLQCIYRFCCMLTHNTRCEN